MSRINNCVFLVCDRCSRSQYYASDIVAKNLGWSLTTRIADEKYMDLCPRCNEKLDNFLHDFLYGELEENYHEPVGDKEMCDDERRNAYSE